MRMACSSPNSQPAGRRRILFQRSGMSLCKGGSNKGAGELNRGRACDGTDENTGFSPSSATS
jgi:hypothetical protein